MASPVTRTTQPRPVSPLIRRLESDQTRGTGEHCGSFGSDDDATNLAGIWPKQETAETSWLSSPCDERRRPDEP